MASTGWVRVQDLVLGRVGGVALILSGVALGVVAMMPGGDGSAPKSESQARVESAPGRLAALLPSASARARAAEPVPAFSAPVVVTIAQRPSEAPATLPRAAPIPKDRDTLARELQKELRRVGCYEGELNGAWTPATRRAMKTFTDRVNATLPVDEPDAVLFAMVQGQQDPVCGKPCPAGQATSEDGRCLPNAILAKATNKKVGPLAERPAPIVTGWSTAVTPAAPAPAPVVASAPLPPEGRMGLAGPTAAPSGAELANVASPPAAAPPPVPRPAASPNRAAPKREVSWTRAMHTRMFERPN